MTLSEELLWRGFYAENNFANPADLDTAPHKFYFGADPSADSLQVGNLAALMMCRCFVKHGYLATLLVGGATGQIGDPKDTAERELKPLDEVARNKQIIAQQFRQVLNITDEAVDNGQFALVDNLDWFKSVNYLDFLREVGKQFSMTQLLDRQFVKDRIGAGGSGISYAEFSYSLIQGYDFLHLFRTRNIDLQLCGADQFGNCVSGVHLINKLEGEKAYVWSLPLVIDKVSGRKFGKSEGNAVWLNPAKTSIFDFYQFWRGASDANLEQFLKFYTELDRPEIEALLAENAANPAARLAGRKLAYEVTRIVHGEENAKLAEQATDFLLGQSKMFSDDLPPELRAWLAENIPTVQHDQQMTAADILVLSLGISNREAKDLVAANAVSERRYNDISILKKGKNTFIMVENVQ
ncbi:MAG: tyrosine--tRNA ligase [Candidatus Nomurabacteria bacterium]|jgi:tyrosyl-tRNA synthetase|nr:tyrosine--tRNA ligase [Candidatus Nomurabacteria bacterium]